MGWYDPGKSGGEMGDDGQYSQPPGAMQAGAGKPPG